MSNDENTETDERAPRERIGGTRRRLCRRRRTDGRNRQRQQRRNRQAGDYHRGHCRRHKHPRGIR
ncbi:hypothetical protein [Bacteroides helcogenes]|uniref:hypothetical protein n=1 Tax=Bacteroides helcogenes TaxID=290053 RepID=UPI002A90ABC6|nr:hypothetical protein [Bacteroides helcogenes]MDY5237378.1 hypothetical protein [Bacteroides helcogenes]